MSYQTRAATGLILIAASLAVLWWGSPDHMRTVENHPAFAFAFLGLFAIGFMVFAMAALGAEGAYPALLSGFVLYFMAGGLFTIYVHITGAGLNAFSLSDAGNPAFWSEVLAIAAQWPLRIVQEIGLFGWDVVPLF